MLKYFLDVGTQFGQGLSLISSREGLNSGVKTFSFEPNPSTFLKIERQDNVRYFNMAVGTETRFMDFNCEEVTGGGSSLLSLDAWNLESVYNWSEGERYNRNKAIKVMTVSILDILEGLCDEKEEHSILMKLDCEGMEYQILPLLHETGNLKWFKTMYVEWHEKSITDKSLIKIDRLGLTKILIDNKVSLVDWY